jgi:hypothetical protein
LLRFFQRRFTLLPDRDDLPARWHERVKALSIKGFARTMSGLWRP